jgi:pyruvate dehydrogenase E1 component alpha subunit
MGKTGVPSDVLIKMFETMVKIRLFEEKVEEFFMKGLIGGSVHLYIGQEAIATGVCFGIEESDYIISTHRGHGHCIAKGGKLDRIMAEILGREEGYCKGKGGSMHVSDIDTRNLGANGIVGAGIPIASGAGLAIKLRKEKDLVVSFFGDGAANTGAFHEGINLASIWKLPVLFVCENNCYAVSAPVCKNFGNPRISERAKAYGMTGVTVDGMDVIEVYKATKKLAERTRRGEGPGFMECLTYRFKGHFVGDPGAYRPKGELAEWQKRDPIKIFREKLIAEKVLTPNEITSMEKKISIEVGKAEKFALECPEPKQEEAFSDIYA